MVRPVDAHGTVAPGYTVTRQLSDTVDCSGTDPYSPVAVDDGIALCSPTALYPVACWPGPSATTALCYRTPTAHQVVEFATTGRIPPTTASRVPSPLTLVLSDGTSCSSRIGGAWSQFDGHPELSGTYYCGGTAVWGSTGTDGIDRSNKVWTVRVAPMSGHGQLRTVGVSRAYFVGTAR